MGVTLRRCTRCGAWITQDDLVVQIARDFLTAMALLALLGWWLSSSTSCRGVLEHRAAAPAEAEPCPIGCPPELFFDVDSPVRCT